jgi:ribonuclease HI
MNQIVIYTDGGARGNPGPAAIGVLLVGESEKLHSEFLGTATNNQAEYSALIRALEMAQDASADSLECFSDSELMVNQLNGCYKVKNPELLKLYKRVKDLEKGFKEVSYTHVRRTNPFIKRVDAALNETLDKEPEK